MIDLVYLWGIKWAEKYSSGNNCYGFLLIVTTAINYICAVGVIIYGFILTNETSDEKVNGCKNYPNILSIIYLVIMFGVQLLNLNKQNSLLATSFLTIFTSYWLIATIYSSESCNNYIIS